MSMNRTQHARRRRATLAALLAVVVAGLCAAPADAIPTDPDDPEQLPPCLRNLNVQSISATPRTVNLGQSATLRWSVRVPAGCVGLRLNLDGRAVSPEGSLRVVPVATTTYTLRAWSAGQLPRMIATITITVVLPRRVTINQNHMAPLLRQAVATPDTTIRVLNGVQLDLSRYKNMPIAEGVTLIGGRSPRARGPRLYTTTRPQRLFIVDGDNVRITGLRIEGPDMGVADGDGGPASGIYISSRINVEIANNEVYGWKNSAIGVNDDDGRISAVPDPAAVRIHDNFIHHNQRKGKFGYGVVIGTGAYALIERNVFDYNRHAIAGDGSDGSGYRAYQNLVLEHGGRHRKVLTKWFYTHQFDMHGQRSCGVFSIFSDALFNCGTAGYELYFAYNSFIYTKGPAIKLRGTPQRSPLGAFVVSNVFAHDDLDDAVKQTESGLYLDRGTNPTGVNGTAGYGTCDFDGDGTNDRFLATGQTWWYSSRGTGHWAYLNTSTKRLAQVTLGNVDGDRRCDVAADGLFSSGGSGPWSPRP